MIIDKNFKVYLVSDTDTLETVLIRIDNNKNKIVFVVDENQKVLGSISDGDIRRWMLKQDVPNFQILSSKICNKEFKFIIEDNLNNMSNNIINSKLSIAPVLNKKKSDYCHCEKKNT